MKLVIAGYSDRNVGRIVAGGLSVLLAAGLAVGVGTSPAAADVAGVTLPPGFLTPAQVTKAYNVDGLHKRGIDGRGVTIVILVPYGSPTIKDDLTYFDKRFGLPDPPSLTTRTDIGTPNQKDPGAPASNVETTLDVEWAHVMAPGANIVIEAPPNFDPDKLVAAEKYVAENELGQVVTESLSAPEKAGVVPSPAALASLRAGIKEAADHRMTVVSSAGDYGAASRGGAARPAPWCIGRLIRR